MDALELVKNEHEMFKKILAELDETTDRAVKTRRELFARLERELVSHEQMEEQVLYPALRKARSKAEEIVLEGYEEHHVADVIVAEMGELDVEDERWGAKMSVLKESLEHHIEEEEGEMFDHARKAFTREQLEELGTKMAEIKKAVKESFAA